MAVNHYYFYVQDREWGPAFLKVGSYLPYPARLYLNGHEWAKRQLERAGIAFTALDNGFRWCADPDRLQQVCDALGPADVQAFFDRWVERLPWPLDPATRAAGYRHRLSLWQVEVSLTQGFDEPSWGRRLVERIIRENLDLGRPDRVSLLFPTRLTRATPPPPGGYRTRVLTRGVQPSLHVEFKHSHVKQYRQLRRRPDRPSARARRLTEPAARVLAHQSGAGADRGANPLLAPFASEVARQGTLAALALRP